MRVVRHCEGSGSFGSRSEIGVVRRVRGEMRASARASARASTRGS